MPQLSTEEMFRANGCLGVHGEGSIWGFFFGSCEIIDPEVKHREFMYGIPLRSL